MKKFVVKDDFGPFQNFEYETVEEAQKCIEALEALGYSNLTSEEKGNE